MNLGMEKLYFESILCMGFFKLVFQSAEREKMFAPLLSTQFVISEGNRGIKTCMAIKQNLIFSAREEKMNIT